MGRPVAAGESFNDLANFAGQVTEAAATPAALTQQGLLAHQGDIAIDPVTATDQTHESHLVLLRPAVGVR
jgi:hypothetical protein